MAHPEFWGRQPRNVGISTEAYLRVPFTKSKLVNPDLALAGLPHTSALHFKFSGLNFF